ncbi:MAG: hypothetical protein MUC94_10040 [bacterium]|jgi:hypothetical protein|nr:hypothetical protein [bacterium]
MKYSIFILLAILFFPLQCARQSYRIHIGESFYPSSQQLTNYGGSAIAAARADTLIELTGIYCDKNVFLDRYPVIRIHSSAQGKLFAPLSARLDCQDGSLINIKGRVVNLPITYSIIKKTLYYNHLEPRTYYTISDNQKIIDKVNVEFQKIRDDLQKKITIEQSKLQLSLLPDWDIWFDEQRNILIFHSHQHDLMYAADIEFIVDAKTGKIKDVFAKEWFKGEM